jgi:signal transduction histidine kinase
MISRVSIALLVIALLTLAGLQYHWIGQISVAERQRLEMSVRDSSNRFVGDFNAEIRSLTSAFDFRGGEPAVVAIVARYRAWAETSSYPDLLRTLYLVRTAPSGEVHLYRVDVENEVLLPAEWPEKMIPLRTYLQRESPGPERRSVSNTTPALPGMDGIEAVLIQLSGGRLQDMQRGRGGPGPGPGFVRSPGVQSQQQPPSPPSPERTDSWLIAELDDAALNKQVFPALVARDFPMTDDQDYRVAIVSIPFVSKTIFSTGKPWTEEDLASPDYSIDLIRGSGQPGQIGGIARGGLSRPGGGRGGGPPTGSRGGPQQMTYVGQGLQLLVKHEAGSLETAVSNLRNRNLAISFGILLVLGLGAGVGIVSGQRARTLGRLQMEFAAGVSHELRTPLAVIQSAAHNLRAGVVRDSEGIEEYAMIVQKEARRLSRMVEQVMTYAETQSGRKRYDITPVDLNAVVDRALQNMAMPLGDANASVENRIDPQLPAAMADEAALTQCIQNLLSNALKYGSGRDLVQIEIESKVEHPEGRIELSVIDHGPGVPLVDEKHLFDPFQRGANAATNTPGNGLGLHLVRRMMEAQKGTVTYSRAENGGACFTLTLPAATLPE